MFRTLIQNIRVYVSSNWTAGFFGALIALLMWCLSIIWNNNNDKIADIAKSTESTAQSMHELVSFVKEDRVKITNLENRVKTLEDWRGQREQLTQDFFRDYDLHKRK